VADAAAISPKWLNAAVPLTTELRGTLEKLCSEMAKCGQIYEAGEMRAIYVATLDSLERVLTNLNPPVPAKK
jgi:hypothetical protein